MRFIDNMKESELREEANRLRLLLGSGDATPKDANRYEQVTLALRAIQRSKHPTR